MVDINKMQNEVVLAYGLESDETIWFFHMCEQYVPSIWNDKLIQVCFNQLMNEIWN